jgi:hypothetical protein
MQTLQWNIRTMTLVAVAAVLTLSVGVMGVWLLFSGQPGAGIMENRDHTAIMGGNDQAGAMMDTAKHDQMMGVPADRGALGGYTGTVGLVMILVFMALIGSLLYAVVKERPSQRQPAACWNCERPVELDWETCPYCGARLDEASQSAHSAEAEPR